MFVMIKSSFSMKLDKTLVYESKLKVLNEDMNSKI